MKIFKEELQNSSNASKVLLFKEYVSVNYYL